MGVGRPDRDRSSEIFLFEHFRFDRSRGGLFRVDQASMAEPVALGSRALELLGVLLDRHGQLVSKHAIVDTIWPHAAVEEGNLTVQMSSLRRILDADRSQGSCIQTVAGRGYRFIAPVTRVAVAAPNHAPPLLAPPDRPSVAILPFTNMTVGYDQECLSDGIAEGIITALSRYPSLFVRARNASFAYKGRPIDPTQVARELRVRYVVEGSVRSAGKRIRATCWLVDAESGSQLWSEHHDRDCVDFFAAQDEVAKAVSIAVVSAISQAEQQRAIRQPTRDLTAWGAYQRGLWHRTRMSAEDNARAEQFFQQSIELDPAFSGGYRALALAQMDAATQFQQRGFEQARSSAETLASQAISLDRTDAEARSAFAAILLIGHGDHEGARIEAERALALTPHLASAHGVLGAVLTYAGQPKDGLASFATNIGLDPNHPTMALRLQQVTAALYFSGDHEAAIRAGKRAIRSYPNYSQVYRWLAAALVRAGRIPEAKQVMLKAMTVAPESFDMYVRQRVPWMRPHDHAIMVDDLVKAGWQHNRGVQLPC